MSRSKIILKAREFDRHKPQWNLSDSGEILFDESALKSLRAKKYSKKIASKLEKKSIGEPHDDSYTPLQIINDTFRELFPQSGNSMNLFGRAIIDALEDHGYEIVKKDNSSWYSNT